MASSHTCFETGKVLTCPQSGLLAFPTSMLADAPLAAEATEGPEVHRAKTVEDCSHLVAWFAIYMETGRLEALKEALDELGAEGAKVNHRRIGVGIPLVEMAHGPTRIQEPLVAQCPCFTAGGLYHLGH